MSSRGKGITRVARRPRSAGKKAVRLSLRGGVGFGGLAEFADHVDEGLNGARQAAIATVDEREFAPEVDPFDGEELYFAGFDLIAGEAFADNGDADVGGDEGFDHADAGKFHGDLQAGTIRAEELVEDLAGVAGPRKKQGRGGDLFERDVAALGEGILGADHEAKAITVDDMHLEIGRFQRERNDAEIERAFLQALQNFVAEIAVDADVDQRIAALEFGKDVGEQVEAGGLIRAEGDGTLNHAAAVGDDLHGFIAQAEKAFGVVEENNAGWRQLDGFRGAIQQLCLVGLLELADLCADGGLRAKYLLAGFRKAF